MSRFPRFGTRNAAAHPIFQCLEVADPGMAFIRILSIIILGLLCVGCVSSQQPSQILADRAYARSVELLSAGQQSAAEDLIEQALESNPDDASLLFAKGVLDRSRWLKHEAMYSFAQLIHGMPGTVSARAVSLSLVLDEDIDAENNLNSLIQLSDANPDNIYLLWLSAIQCREQKKGALGKIQYEKLLSHFDVGPVLLHQSYANILTEQLKEYDEALKHRRLAVLMEPRGWSYQGLANTLRDMGNYEESCEAWEKCLELDPDDADYWRQWSRTLQRMKRYNEALVKSERSVQADPSNYLCWFEWGDSFYGLEQYEEAFQRYQEASRLNRSNAGSVHCMALCKMKLEQYEEMEQLFLKAADRGSQRAMNYLAWCYAHGRGVDEDLAKAAEWYEKAALLGSRNAQSEAARCYAFGKGVEKNWETAARWYQVAAEQGDAPSQFMLAECYARGRGIEKNEVAAFKWYTRSAKAGWSGGQLGLGLCYQYGRGVQKNLTEAVRWYQASASKNNIAALMRLANCYETGNGVEKNREKADECYRKALDVNPDYKPARLKLEDTGPRFSTSTDVETLTKAAENGDAVAQRILGFRYQWGDKEFRNPELAVRWYKTAAEQDESEALWRLARCYAEGTGTNVDESAALACFERALDRAPDSLMVWFSFARFLATCENDEIRDEKRALVLAEKAVEKRENVTTLHVLSQVYAASGRYEDAFETATRLVEIWEKSNQGKDLPSIFADRLKEYKEKAEAER